MNRMFFPAMAGVLLLSAASGWAQSGPYGVGLNGLGGTHASPMTTSTPTRTTVDSATTDSLNAINPSGGPSPITTPGTPLDEIPGVTNRRGDASADPIATMPSLTDFPNGR